MTFAEEQNQRPADGPDAGGTSQGEPGGAADTGTGDDRGRERAAEPDPQASSNEKADSAADVDETPSGENV